MSQKNFYKIRNSRISWWTILLVIVSLLLLIFILRNCNRPNVYYSNTKTHNKSIVIEYPYPGYPDNPNRLIPIDSTKLITPDDSIKRPIIANILNIYLDDTVTLKQFSNHLISTFAKDRIEVKYYAEEYKRIQITVPENRRDSLKIEIKSAYNEVKFVCNESVISNSNIVKTDPGYNNNKQFWFYEQIGLFEAWNTSLGDSSITIAVIDDAFDVNHPELASQITKQWNVYEYSDNLTTWNNKMIHGTHVAGTIAGVLNNNYGISGIAPKCKLMLIQIADKQGRMTTTSILDGIFYALKNGADVINMSLGVEMKNLAFTMTKEQQEEYAKKSNVDEAKMWDEVYRIANKEGVVIVQAAGNSNVIAALDPMKRSSASIVVGATNRKKEKADFSNYGNDVDIYAPGVDIYSSVPGKNFTFMDGTSMSSPIVAGCIGIIKSINDSISTDKIKVLLKDYGMRIKNSNDKIININNVILNIK